MSYGSRRCSVDLGRQRRELLLAGVEPLREIGDDLLRLFLCVLREIPA